jgi:hypothetical protein
VTSRSRPGKRRDIDQGDNPILRSGVRDQRSAVGVTDQDDRAFDPTKAADDRGDVAAELGSQHLMAFCLKRRDQLAEARPVGPQAVGEHDARFGLHGHRTLHRFEAT